MVSTQPPLNKVAREESFFSLQTLFHINFMLVSRNKKKNPELGWYNWQLNPALKTYSQKQKYWHDFAWWIESTHFQSVFHMFLNNYFISPMKFFPLEVVVLNKKIIVSFPLLLFPLILITLQPFLASTPIFYNNLFL